MKYDSKRGRDKPNREVSKFSAKAPSKKPQSKSATIYIYSRSPKLETWHRKPFGLATGFEK